MSDILDVTLDSLCHLICSEREDKQPGGGQVAPIHFLHARDFDGFEPFFNDDEEILIAAHPGDQPVWPFDISVAMPAHGSWPNGSLVFHRLKTLKPAEWRGKIHKVYPRMLDHRFMVTRPNGRSVAGRVPYGIVGDRLVIVSHTNASGVPGGELHPDWFGGREDQRIDRASVDLARGAAGITLRRRYHWSVLIGEGQGPRARFITDAPGMRAVFRLRDIPPGRARRTALLHWVRAHWRKRRDPTANDRDWIRTHLRGVWSYTWNGLVCQLEPAEYDVEAALKQTRPDE